MDMKDFISPLLRWWWLLLASTLVAAVTSFIVVIQQPPEYLAWTTLMVGRTIADPNPSGGELQMGQQLAGIYADIAEREPVRQATMDALYLDWLPDYNARALPNSQLIEIAISDTVPERAQIVANELARQLILQSPTSPQQEDQERQAFISEQLKYLEEKIAETQDDIETKQLELADMVSARQIADTQQAITALQDKLVTLQANYASLLANTQSGAVNTLSVIEPAGLPQYPVGPDVLMITGLAAAVGFSIAAGGAYLLEYLDDTLRTPEDIERAFQVPVLGYIAKSRVIQALGKRTPLVVESPLSPLAEAFRSLRTNIEFAGNQRMPRTLLLGSPGPGEGKSTVAYQLAAALAESHMRAIVVDADLRRAKGDEYMGIQSDVGLSDMITEDLIPQIVTQSTGDSRLKILARGSKVDSPADLLNSSGFTKALSRLKDQSEVVIFDGPSMLVAEFMQLASRVEGVLLVVQSGKTREGIAAAIRNRLERAQANFLGVVLNQVPRRKILASPEFGFDYRAAMRMMSNGRPDAREVPRQIQRPQPTASEVVKPFIGREGGNY